MIWLTSLLIVTSVAAIAYMAMPADLRALAAENCRDPQGRLRWNYAVKELGSLASFYGWMLLAAGLLSGMLLLPLVWVHDRWIPLGIAVEATMRFHPRPDVWRERLTAPPEDLVQRHRQWAMEQGVPRGQVRTIQSLLWRAIPLGLLLAAIAVWLVLRWLGKGYRTGIEQLAEVVFARRTARLTAHYLQDAEQRRQQAAGRMVAHATRRS